MGEQELTAHSVSPTGGSDEPETHLIMIRLLDKIETIQNKHQDG